MSAQPVVVAVLLACAVLLTLLVCAAVLVVEEAIDRLHYLTPVAAVAVPLVAVAVMVSESPISAAGAKAALVVLAFFLTGPVLSHAIARAERIRTHGDWRARPEEKPDR